MVHVANAEGHRKMLAFQPPSPLSTSSSTGTSSSSTTNQQPPHKNLNNILIDTISLKFESIPEFTEEKVSESSSIVQLKNDQNFFTVLPTYKSNSLNLSCIIEEEPPPSMMNSTIQSSLSTSHDDPNCNLMTSGPPDPNLNMTSTVTTTSYSNLGSSPEGGGRVYTESVTTTTVTSSVTKVSKKRSASPTFSPEKVIQSHLTESSSLVSPETGKVPGAEKFNPEEVEFRGESSDICFHSSEVGNPEEGTVNDDDSRKSFTSIPKSCPSGGADVTLVEGSCPDGGPSENRVDDPSSATTHHHCSMLGKQGKSINGTKNVCLKRVSFGSSKGSMVETVIFESQQPEERSELVITPNGTPTSEILKIGGIPVNDALDSPTTATGSTGGSRPPSRVRVTFFESEKPLALSSPDSSEPFDLDLSNMTLPQQSPVDTSTPNNYSRHLSVESGWENPFRPDGDLSQEADQIVELIKKGIPINDETLRSISPSVHEHENEVMHSTNYTINLTASPPQGGKGTNGSATNGMEVQRGVVVPPSQTGAVEHVTLKKKKGCCVIQ